MFVSKELQFIRPSQQTPSRVCVCVCVCVCVKQSYCDDFNLFGRVSINQLITEQSDRFLLLRATSLF